MAEVSSETKQVLFRYDKDADTYYLNVEEFTNQFVDALINNKQISRISTSIAESVKDGKVEKINSKVKDMFSFIFEACLRKPAQRAIRGERLESIELPEFMKDLMIPCGVYLDATQFETFADFRASIKLENFNQPEEFDYSDYRTVIAGIYGAKKSKPVYASNLYDATKPVPLVADLRIAYKGEVELDRQESKLPVPLKIAIKNEDYYTQTLDAKMASCIKLVVEAM